MYRYLNDSELAVTMDALVFMRDHLKEKNEPSPNVSSALLKIQSLVRIDTYGLKIESVSAMENNIVPSEEYARWD